MTLPKDLSSYRTKRILKGVIPFAISEAVLITALILWGDTIFTTDHKAVIISCSILVLLIPFAITGVPFKLIDSTYCGTVKKVDVVTTTDNQSSVKPSLEQSYLKNTIYLTVEKPDGKCICKKVYSGKASLQQNINTYREGDKVFHLYGTNTVIRLPDASDTTVSCTVCASSNETQKDLCRHCGHSLIKGF